MGRGILEGIRCKGEVVLGNDRLDGAKPGSDSLEAEEYASKTDGGVHSQPNIAPLNPPKKR